MTDAERAQAALDLWKELFEQLEDMPYFSYHFYGDTMYKCFFCEVAESYPGDIKHDPDCIYIRARKLVEEAANG